ncbi:hypothetical protein BBO99_00001547 [Phytophthora kernoviae]|uniref:tRNA-uridine aminocarboxypropyltransferase 1 n=2 Tax=Phytophthora kernoviae TaxID=325452 RepID=A0A3R7IIJ4_9STRA|nr:hypothetical protein G195_003744 [Phytophthora kernoviae 00238/432]KAG2530143.1 hypothetical protein JM18_002419 [Phytophthora kernoviae]KAG2531331.1 hypothetical protein JM16_001071 [Phytophthora kernoviae]RLN20341.1 hypothetical protein BBI17_001370 [Phytophthora kernoviae]RLN84179.1 hypothetical protein BBO99_00001547 [Phytophthora kernoviae]
MSEDIPIAQQPKAWQRLPCTSCQRSYKFYCPKCYIPLSVPEGVTVPSLKLPLQVHVFFQDKVKKSTAPHAKVLASDDVEIIPYPPVKGGHPLPTYTREDTVVVYPSFEAETLEEISAEELLRIRTLVFIDCPWQKAPVIMTDPALNNLRHVKLAQPPKESNFWRYHKAGAGCVSTIEAIQMMLEEYTAAAKKVGIKLSGGSENTQLSDLLFFFKLQFARIVEIFDKEADPSRKPPMDADEKERRRLMYCQKEAGKKRRLENKLQAWEERAKALQSGKLLPETTHNKRHRRCYNCKKDDHHSKDCLHPCRYCKQLGHFSANCTMKEACHEREMKFQQTPRTKAL